MSAYGYVHKFSFFCIMVRPPPRPTRTDTLLPYTPLFRAFTPSVHLFAQSRGKLAWDADLQAYLPGQSAEAERSAGACRGRFALDEALSDGIDAGRAAARAAGFSPQTQTAGPSAFVLHRNGGGGYIGAAPEIGRASGRERVCQDV